MRGLEVFTVDLLNMSELFEVPPWTFTEGHFELF